jgi:hypothetical protein
MRNTVIRFAMCVVFLIASQQGSFAQWKQCKGFSNAIGNNNLDDVAGFLAVGNYLLADAKCGYNQTGATPDSLFQSTDNGQTWVSYSANGGFPLAAIGNDLIGCVTLPSSAPNTEVLSYSSDKGRTWHVDTLGWPNPDASAAALLSIGSTIYMSCGMSGVYQQTAPGARWTPDTAGMTIAYQGVLYTYPVTRMITLGNTIFAAAGFNAGIYISTNKGASWSKADNGLPNIDTVTAWLPTWAFAVSGSSVFALIACDSTDNTYDCYRTTNEGQNWTKMSAKPQTWSNITPQLVASGQNLFASTDSGFYYSTNSGATWSKGGQGLPTANGPYICTLTISGGNVVVSTFENGVWYRKLSDFGIS